MTTEEFLARVRALDPKAEWTPLTDKEFLDRVKEQYGDMDHWY